MKEPKKLKKTTPVSVQEEVAKLSDVTVEYTTGMWSGKKQYRCAHPRCAFDTLDERAMLEHLFSVHNSAAAMEALIEMDGGTAADGGEIALLKEVEGGTH